MNKKPTVERYNVMDEISSKEEWNADFGTMLINVFENAVQNGEVNKTVEQLIDELEAEFYKDR